MNTKIRRPTNSEAALSLNSKRSAISYKPIDFNLKRMKKAMEFERINIPVGENSLETLAILTEMSLKLQKK